MSGRRIRPINAEIKISEQTYAIPSIDAMKKFYEATVQYCELRNTGQAIAGLNKGLNEFTKLYNYDSSQRTEIEHYRAKFLELARNIEQLPSYESEYSLVYAPHIWAALTNGAPKDFVSQMSSTKPRNNSTVKSNESSKLEKAVALSA